MQFYNVQHFVSNDLDTTATLSPPITTVLADTPEAAIRQVAGDTLEGWRVCLAGDLTTISRLSVCGEFDFWTALLNRAKGTMSISVGSVEEEQSDADFEWKAPSEVHSDKKGLP